jgi:hypothetical protein
MAGMETNDARRLIETASYETANQYLRFGWKMVNQYVAAATADRPSEVRYVLASVRSLADVKDMVECSDAAGVNAYLAAGWQLIDKYLTSSEAPERRHETLHFVLAWQSEEPPVHPELPDTKTAVAENNHGADDKPAGKRAKKRK